MFILIRVNIYKVVHYCKYVPLLIRVNTLFFVHFLFHLITKKRLYPLLPLTIKLMHTNVNNSITPGYATRITDGGKRLKKYLLMIFYEFQL